MTVIDLILNKQTIAEKGLPCRFEGQPATIIGYSRICGKRGASVCYAKVHLTNGETLELKPRYLRKVKVNYLRKVKAD
jgi:hypothetical protein